MNKFIFVFLFVVFSSAAFEVKLDDEHKFFFVVKKNNLDVKMTAKSIGKERSDFEVNDYIYNCELDSELSLIKTSLEKKSIGGVQTTLFAYRIGCFGDVEPIPIKYFAFQNGIKYALRGEETIQTPNGNYGGEEEPIPGRNLKKNTILYKYMRDRWKDISLRKYYE
ncbi:M949_RS01915 family surface polysaccharide biosynthesis protein [Aeromonas salmonicida]|uniref:M949_RS01915 family surface polysaccharide biosynthesis protein n=1 Tax=Aeromonas salmonicida TaxID=645 RepID=UPI0030CAEAC4